MLLRNVRTIHNYNLTDIRFENGRIVSVDDFMANGEPVISFIDAIAFPGLINSHDHLDFNLFPKLGNKLHSNYVEWSNYIHTHNKTAINRVLQIPKELRVQWGVYKNLINGVTTVVNHGPLLKVNDDLITVFQKYHLLHSVQLEKYWKYLLNKPFKKKRPFVIHIGEGGDESSHTEIDNLRKWNLCNRDIIGIHGIAMNEAQASFFKALVWCPASNFFLIGKTAPIDKLRMKTDILFGTDSTLSSSWNLWEHLRLARSRQFVKDEDLYDMLNTTPARIWNMAGCGKIEKGYDADIVVARRKGALYGFDAYYATDPADILLVIHKGNIRLFDAELLEQVSGVDTVVGDFSEVVINGVVKYVYGDVPRLIKQIKNYCNDVIFPFESKDKT